MLENRVKDVAELLRLIAQAMTSSESVTVVTLRRPTNDTICFRIVLESRRELGLVIGTQGRIARSLRLILSTIAYEHQLKYELDIVGPDATFIENTH